MANNKTIPSFSMYVTSIVTQTKSLGQVRTAETYALAERSFMRFRGGVDCSLAELTAPLILQYEAYLRATGLCPNSIAFYLKRLQALYNKAVNEGLVTQQYPFRQAHTAKAKTVKRAVSEKVIRKISKLDLSKEPRLAFARDLFVLSFFTRGMAFVDMANLRQSNLRDGMLTYCRQKSRAPLTLRWEPCMQQIVDTLWAYPQFQAPRYQSSGYLLPILDSQGNRYQLLRAQQRVNYALHGLSQLMRLTPSLTMYVARHSWATYALRHGVPLAMISESLGHESLLTTQIYLASIDQDDLDNTCHDLLVDFLKNT